MKYLNKAVLICCQESVPSLCVCAAFWRSGRWREWFLFLAICNRLRQHLSCIVSMVWMRLSDIYVVKILCRLGRFRDTEKRLSVLVSVPILYSAFRYRRYYRNIEIPNFGISKYRNTEIPALPLGWVSGSRLRFPYRVSLETSRKLDIFLRSSSFNVLFPWN